MVVEEVKEELKKLCTDYLNILQQLNDLFFNRIRFLPTLMPLYNRWINQ